LLIVTYSPAMLAPPPPAPKAFVLP